MSRHSEASRTLDTVVVALLAGMVLLCFDSTFADRSYLVGAVAGLLTVGAIVLVVDYYDKGVGVVVLCALPAYVLVGAAVGVRTTDDYVRVPTLDDLVGTLSASIGAGNQLLTTIPPIDAVGDATLIPYALVFVVAGVALWLALCTERPLAPLVPLLMGLAAGILLGTQQRELLQVQSAVFAGLSLWWVAQRGARGGRVVAGSRGRTARAVGAVALVGGVAAATAVVLPPPEDDDLDRVVLRGRVGAGADVASLATPLSSFRAFTRQPPTAAGNVFDVRLLRVEGLPRGVPLRFVALDSYDGVTWQADNRTVVEANDDLFLRVGSVVDAPRRGRPVEVQVEVTADYLSDWLPLPGQLTGVSFVFLDGRAQRDDVRYNPATTTAVVLGGLDGGDDFRVEAVVPPADLGPRARAFDTPGPLEPDGAFLDEALEPWRASGLSPMRQVRSLAEYLRSNGRYSDGASPAERRYEAGHDAERLGEGFFLAPRIVGDDEQYASFMALAANRLGVPARVVVGASPGRRGWVQGRDVQAWVELRTADGSWRTLATREFMGSRPPRPGDVRPELPSDFLGLDDAQESPQQRPEPPPRPEGAEQEVSGGDEGTAGSGRWGWIALLGLLTWGVPLAKVLRRRVRAARGSSATRIVAGWREVLDHAGDLGRPVPAGLGRVEQARRLDLDPGPAVSAQEALFARRPPEAEQAADFWVTVRSQRRTLSRRASPLRRMWALWNPASLVPSRWRRTRTSSMTPAVR